MECWNVVVTVQPECYREARRLLEPFGRVHRTAFYNVIAMRVEDVRQFLEALREKMLAFPAQYEGLCHIMPAQKAFSFQSPEGFEISAREAVVSWVPELAGKTFYVRMHRRGFKGRLSSQDEEYNLGKFLLEGLEKMGCPGRITFDDPDAICVVETLGQWAGLSLWTREDRQRFPFLHLD